MGEGSCRVVGWGEDEKREGKGGKKGRSERRKEIKEWLSLLYLVDAI